MHESWEKHLDRNKPIITTRSGDIEHLKILGEKALIYSSKDELLNIFRNIVIHLNKYDDWNCYKFYTPENVMNLFNDLIFKKKISSNNM